MENRRDLSVSMLRANGIVIFVTLPVVILQFLVFAWLHGVEDHPTNSGCYLIEA